MTASRIMPRWVQPFIWVMALGVGILGGLLALQLYRSVWRPPPFAYTSDVYLPQKAKVCPGEAVTWQPALTVLTTPTLLMVVRTLWDASEDRTIIPDTQPKYFVWTDAQRGQVMNNRVVSYTLPASLESGFYEIRSAASGVNSDASAYRVPFVVPESCFKKGVK